MDYLPFADAHSEVKLVLAHLGNSGDMRPGEGGGASAIPRLAHAAGNARADLIQLPACASCPCWSCCSFASHPPAKPPCIAGDPTHQLRAIAASRNRNIYVDTSSAASITPGLVECAPSCLRVVELWLGSECFWNWRA